MDTFVRVAVLDNDIEAAALAVILDDQRIPHMMQSYHDSAYDGIFQDQKGWGCVMAPRANEQEIRDILEEMRAAE